MTSLNADTDKERAAIGADESGERVSRAYLAIRDLIIRGRLAAGDRVIEADVAASLGISRTPVRQALGRLEHEGFLVPAGPTQRKRLIVAPVTAADFLELCRLIGAYEGLALSTIDRVTSERRARLADELAGVNAKLRSAVVCAEQDADRVFALLTDFHTTFFDALAGPRLRTVYASLRPLVERYEWAYADLVEGQVTSSIDEHDLIIAAVRAGSGQTAEATVRLHWERSGLRVSNALSFLEKRSEAT